MDQISIEKLALYLDNKLSAQERDEVSEFLIRDRKSLETVIQVVKSNVLAQINNNSLHFFQKLSGIIDVIIDGSIQLLSQDTVAVRSQGFQMNSFEYNNYKLDFLQKNILNVDLIISSDQILEGDFKLLCNEDILSYAMQHGECIVPLEYNNEYVLLHDQLPPLHILLENEK